VLHSAPKVKYFVQKVYFFLMQISKQLLKRLLKTKLIKVKKYFEISEKS